MDKNSSHSEENIKNRRMQYKDWGKFDIEWIHKECILFIQKVKKKLGVLLLCFIENQLTFLIPLCFYRFLYWTICWIYFSIMQQHLWIYFFNYLLWLLAFAFLPWFINPLVCVDSFICSDFLLSSWKSFSSVWLELQVVVVVLFGWAFRWWLL